MQFFQGLQIALALQVRAILVIFEKNYSCLFIPNCTRNHVITYTYTNYNYNYAVYHWLKMLQYVMYWLKIKPLDTGFNLLWELSFCAKKASL